MPAQAIEDTILDALRVQRVDLEEGGAAQLGARVLLEPIERLDVLEGQITITLKVGSQTHDGTDQEPIP